MNQRSVLVIDDSKLHQSFIGRALGRADFEVCFASTGLEGLAQLSKRKFDIVLLDLALPDLSGVSVARTIRDMRNLATVPICVVTAELQANTRQDLQELDIFTILQKGSFQGPELIEVINSAIDRAAFHQEIHVLLIESPNDFRQALTATDPTTRLHIHSIANRQDLASFVATNVPDVVVLYESGDPPQLDFVTRYYQDGLLQGIPWVIACSGGIPPSIDTTIQNRVIAPISLPCPAIQVVKLIELLAHFHKTRISSEENALELEIAYAEMEKNRLALTEVKSALTQLKNNFGTTLAKVGGEIREPLTAILGFAEALRRTQPEDSRDRDAFNTMLNSGQYLSQVVDDILSIAAIERGYFTVQRKQFDFLVLVGELGTMVRQRALAAGLSFAITFESEIPVSIYSDPTVLRQLLSGLLDNALKFTHHGSIRLRISYNKAFSQLTLAISDTGPGIPPEQIAHLFNTFGGTGGTQPNVQTGAGLGLWFVKFAAERLGGELQLSSRVGVGSTFTVLFDPGEIVELIDPDFAYTVLDLDQQSAEIDPATIRGSILAYDYYPDNQRLLAYLFDQTQVKSVFVRKPSQIPQLVFGGNYDALVIDVLTPEVDGFSLVRNIRQLGFAKPIIAASAYMLEEQRQRCIDVGCNEVLDKPFSVEKFYQVLAKVLRPIEGGLVVESSNSRVLPSNSSRSTEPSQAESNVSELSEAEFSQADLFESQLTELQLIAGEFSERLPTQLQTIRMVANGGNWNLLAEIARDLLCSAEMHGATDLGLRAEELIGAARTQEEQLILACISELEHASEALLKERSSDSESMSEEPGEGPAPERPDAKHPVISPEYAEVIRSKLVELESAVVNDAWIEVYELAQGLEESAADCEFPELTHQLLHLESLCQGCDRTTILNLINSIRACVKRAVSPESGSEQFESSEISNSTLLESNSFDQAIDELEHFLTTVSIPTPAASYGAPQTPEDDEAIETMLLQLGDLLDSEEYADSSLHTDSDHVFPQEASSRSGSHEFDQHELLDADFTTASALDPISTGLFSAAFDLSDSASHRLDIADSTSPLDTISREILGDFSLSRNSAPTAEQSQSLDATDQLLMNELNALSNLDGLRSLEDSERSRDGTDRGSSHAPDQEPDTEADSCNSEASTSEAVDELIHQLETEVENDRTFELFAEMSREPTLLSAFEPVPDSDPVPETPTRRMQLEVIESELLTEEPAIAPLVLDFLDELKVLVSNIRLAFSERNWKEFGYIAQEISGAAGMCGYPSCAETARQLQQAGTRKLADSVASNLPQLEAICDKMMLGRTHLEKISQELANPDRSPTSR